MLRSSRATAVDERRDPGHRVLMLPPLRVRAATPSGSAGSTSTVTRQPSSLGSKVPLPEAVAVALAERLREFPSGEDGLVFTSREHKPLARAYFNPHIWKPALKAAGIAPTRENGMHALRHFYASVLLDAGKSIRALAEYLGHAGPGFKLWVDTHLSRRRRTGREWPSTESSAEVQRTLRGLQRPEIAEIAGQEVDAPLLRHLSRFRRSEGVSALSANQGWD